MKLKPHLAPTMLRVGVAPSKAGPVTRDGGKYGAGLIEGYSVIARGEALGHGMWIDDRMLDQVAKAGAARKLGTKVRFTHPGMSSDGMGKLLGSAFNFRRDGDRVIADLHLLEAAHKAPDGDLAGYVMDLAEEAPDKFGTSIVFSPDAGEEDRFRAKHTDKQGRFISPDEDNAQHLPHARLASLHASDVVDDPAANPAGLFSAEATAGSLAGEAEPLLMFAVGLSDDAPEVGALGLHPNRVRDFVAGFLERHGLSIVEREAAPEVEPAADTPEPISDAPAPVAACPQLTAMRLKQRQVEAEQRQKGALS